MVQPSLSQENGILCLDGHLGAPYGAAPRSKTTAPAPSRSEPYPQALSENVDFTVHHMPQVAADSKPKLAEMVGDYAMPPPLFSSTGR